MPQGVLPPAVESGEGAVGSAARLLSALAPPNPSKTAGYASLSTLLADRYGPPPWRIHAIKMDIEGSEFSVLPSMIRWHVI